MYISIMKKNYFTNYLNKFSKIHLDYDNKFLKIVKILKKLKR